MAVGRRQPGQRVVGTDAEMAIRVCRIQGLQKDAVSHSSGNRTQLPQPATSQFPYPGDIPLVESRTRRDLDKQREPLGRIPTQCREGQCRRVRPDLGAEPSADQVERGM